MSTDMESTIMCVVFVAVILLQLLALHLFGGVEVRSAEAQGPGAASLRAEAPPAAHAGVPAGAPPLSMCPTVGGGSGDSLAGFEVLAREAGEVALPEPLRAFRARRCAGPGGPRCDVGAGW
mmetsp:Transcript_39557/g.112169  ORF Transcript_39557/g.112169 Transcript_39557/m.112169 type:complete len:121 (-) Transcript_39557:156-518(-)